MRPFQHQQNQPERRNYNSKDEDKNKIHKYDDINMIYNMYHNVPKYQRNMEIYEDHFGERNDNLLLNEFYKNEDKYKEDIIEEKIIEFDMKYINITNENINYNRINLQHEFEQNHRVLFQIDRVNYYIQKNNLCRLGFENAYKVVDHIVKVFKQIGELTVKIFPSIEMIKILGIIHKNYYNYISYGTTIKNVNSRQYSNKIKLHKDILNIKPYKNLFATIEEDSENMHWIVGSLRKGEESYIKNIIRGSHVDCTFIGIGENLSRFEDFPGIYFNYYDEKVEGDKLRFEKYMSNTSKTVQQRFLTTEIINEMNIEKNYVFHSTDVAYYISSILNYDFNEHVNAVQYHTFNIYHNKNIETENNIYYLKIKDGQIVYKPNGNEHPYKHKHVKIHNVEINIEFVEELFIKKELKFKVKKNFDYSVEFLNVIKVSKDMCYCSIRMERKVGTGNLLFTTRYHNYINENCLIEEAEYLEDMKQLGDIEIKEKLSSEEFCSQNYEKFMKWFDGNENVDDNKIYTYKETAQYKNGLYFFKDELFILKVFSHKNENKSLPQELNRNKLFYKKYNVQLKIKKCFINKIITMYRGMNIPESNIKNTLNSIVTLGHEEWHIDIDYELALVLAIFCARYVGRMNKTIKKEVENNKELYDDKEYDENPGFFKKIKQVWSKYERDAEECVDLVSSVVNSSAVNEIIESQKISFMDNFYNYSKLYLMKGIIKFYGLKASIKEMFTDLTTQEKAIKDRGSDVYTFLKNKMQYNKLGCFLKTGKDMFNKYKSNFKKTSVEMNVDTLKNVYYYLYGSSPKIILNYIYIFFVFFPIFAILFTVGEFIIQTFSLKIFEALTNMRFFDSFHIGERIFLGLILLILNGINSHFNHNKTRHVFFILINFYSILVFREVRIVNCIVHAFTSKDATNKHFFIIFFICFAYMINKVFCYSDEEYVSKIIYNPGSCTMNDAYSMYTTLMLMYKSMKDYIRINKLTERNSKKFEILKINKPRIVHKVSAANKMPLVQKSFKIDGHNVISNEPLKLHDCFWCECEAVYRQIQSKIDYDDKTLEDFKKFAQKKLDNILDGPLSEIKGFDLDAYISKLGVKSKEFMQGYLDYDNYKKLIMAFKMHVKIDEKIYINYGKYKVKARNISAQNKRVKLLMGIICEILMSILHHEEWCGPGSTNDQKCAIFEKWIKEIPECGVVCADGSAFDSTQHAKIQEVVDVYAFNKVINSCGFLQKFAESSDFKKICSQESFVVFSKYFKYKCNGTQMSGRMNTCLGNTLRSYLYVEYIKYKLKQEYFFINIDNIREMVNGDDQIIFMRKSLFDYYERIAYKYVYYKEDVSIKYGLGQIAKIFDKYPMINGAEFLSCILLYDHVSGKCLMVRKLERFLQLTPFTYNNKFLNINKFRYMNAKLMFDDSMNILSVQNNLSIYKIYAWKMYEIAFDEMHMLEKKIKFSKKFLKKVEQRLEEHRYKMKFKSYNSPMEYCDRNNEQDGYIFDKLYYEYLEKNYDIKPSEIEELITTITNINSNNYLEQYRCTIIDKLHKCNTIDKYLKTNRELEKTKVETTIKLDGEHMKIYQYHRD